MVRQFLVPSSHCPTDEQRTVSPERGRLVVVSGGFLLPDFLSHDRSLPESVPVSGALGAPVWDTRCVADDFSGGKVQPTYLTVDADVTPAPGHSGVALAAVAEGNQKLFLPEPAGECLQTLNPEFALTQVSPATSCDVLHLQVRKELPID